MIWLTWRQFRASARATAAALALLGVICAFTGTSLADEYAEGLAACTADRWSCMALSQDFFHDHQAQFFLVNGLALAFPVLIGLFWGAPMVTREFEAGTHGLVWNQSITRTRWLATKLGLVGLAVGITAGLGTLAITWWSHPVDKAAAGDFPRMEPLLFAARGIVPVGYAAFAFVLGVAAGLLARRTLPAMAVTLAVFAAVQVATPTLVRPHLLEPVRSTIEISEMNAAGFKVERIGPDRVGVDAGDTGAWLLTSQTVDATGRPVDTIDVTPRAGSCEGPPGSWTPECFYSEVTRLGYRQAVTYHPASQFWAMQGIETGIFVALSLGLVGFCLRRIRHVS